jgi:hypothetical protein
MLCICTTKLSKLLISREKSGKAREYSRRDSDIDNIDYLTGILHNGYFAVDFDIDRLLVEP